MTTPASIAVRVGAGAEQRQFEFQQPVVLIGSADSCDVRVEDQRLDGRMIALCAVGGRIIPIELERRDLDKTRLQARIAGRGDVSLARLGITAELTVPDGRAGLLEEFISRSQNQLADDVGLYFVAEAYGILSVIGFTHQRQIVKAVQEHRQSTPDNIVIVHDHYTNGLGH